MLRELEAYIVVKPKKWSELTGRMTTRLPSLSAGEIAVKVTIQVPDALFKRPQLQAKIVIPESSVTAPVLDATVLDNVRQVLEQQTGMDIRVSLVENES